jgi:hypothetical protein
LTAYDAPTGAFSTAQIPAQGTGSTFLAFGGGGVSPDNLVMFNSTGAAIDSGIPISVFSPFKVDLTAQSADISSTLLYNAPTGMYRVSVYIVETTADGVSSTLPSVTIQWADPDSSTLMNPFVLTPTNSGNAINMFQQASMVIDVKNGGGLNYATTGYTSGTPNVMQFALHIRVEAL